MPNPAPSHTNSAAAPQTAAHKPLRIALLGYRSHPHVGGQGIYVQYLSKALVEAGHSVDVISGPPYPELDARVRLIQLPSLDLYAHPNPTRALRFRHLRSWADTYEWWSKLSGGFGEPYSFGRRLVRFFKQHKPAYDIVHDNQSLCYGLLQLQKMGYCVVATVHHPITQDRDLALAAATTKGHAWLIRRWYSFLTMQARVVQRLRHVLSVSQQSARDIQTAFARPQASIRVIPNGVDTQIFKPLPHIALTPYRLITTASSDQPLKGFAVLLRACAQLRAEFPALTLLVIGQLKSGGSSERELAQLQLGDCVEFISGISTGQMVEEYARASIAVVPSLYEGFGLPAAEAMACGIPLVCSDGGALPEVTGSAAYLVKAGDEIALAAALRELLNNGEQREQLGQAGRAHIEQQLSWQCVARQMQNYYGELLVQSPAPHTAIAPEITGSANAHH